LKLVQFYLLEYFLKYILNKIISPGLIDFCRKSGTFLRGQQPVGGNPRAATNLILCWLLFWALLCEASEQGNEQGNHFIYFKFSLISKNNQIIWIIPCRKKSSWVRFQCLSSKSSFHVIVSCKPYPRSLCRQWVCEPLYTRFHWDWNNLLLPVRPYLEVIYLY